MKPFISPVKDHVLKWLIWLVAFTIPFKGPVSVYAIILLLLYWLYYLGFGSGWGRIAQKEYMKGWVPLVLLYMLYLAGMLYTGNPGEGWFSLQVKLPMLLFPLFFFSLESSFINIKLLKTAGGFFAAGTVFISVILLVRAFVCFREQHDPLCFFYSNLSWYHHASYFSMYCSFSAGLLGMDAGRESKRAHNLYRFILILFLMTMVLLLSSKAGLGSLGITAVAVLAHHVMRRHYLQVLSEVIFLVSFAAVAWHVFPVAFNRMSQAMDTVTQDEALTRDTAESTTIRIHIWRTALGLFREHPLIGVGTGDTRTELGKKYRQQGLDNAFTNHLNAHNQYLQTGITLGITGLAGLLLMLAVPLIRAVQSRDIAFLMFLLITGFNLMAESMLETQAGVVFITFFNSIFLASNGSGVVIRHEAP
ncbi:MAG: O-antigen ligase family protein [Bacteroidales bacterium]|nr:O-antigen ligase family protein [Bacteroidales bacterium]